MKREWRMREQAKSCREKFLDIKQQRRAQWQLKVTIDDARSSEGKESDTNNPPILVAISVEMRAQVCNLFFRFYFSRVCARTSPVQAKAFLDLHHRRRRFTRCA